jgi:hypothetical protein
MDAIRSRDYLLPAIKDNIYINEKNNRDIDCNTKQYFEGPGC